MSDREIVLHALRRVRRRARINRAIRISSWGLGVFLLPLPMVWGLWLLGLRTLPSSGALIGVWSALVGMGLLWFLVRRGALGEAAGLADHRAGLKDELKTAHGFIREARTSPWIDYQIHRAASTARRLDPRRIVPLILPGRLLVLDGFMLFLSVLLWHSARLPHPAELARSEVGEQVRAIGDLLRSSGEEGEGLSRTIERLERGEASLEETLRELEEEKNRLSESNLDMGAFREEMEEIATDLESVESTRELAEFLKAFDLTSAAELLRSLAEQWKETPPQDAAELRDVLALAEDDSRRFDKWLEALLDAVDSLQSNDLEEVERPMEEAADALDSMSEWMRAQEHLNEAARQVGKLRGSLIQQNRSSPLLQPPADERPAPGSEEVPISAIDAQWKDEKRGSPAGYPGGPGRSIGEQREQPTSLKVNLEREMLQSKEDSKSPVPEELQEAPSREKPSRLTYEEIQPRSRYGEADVMNPERIPWRFRDLIKSYFLTIQGRFEP